MSVQDIVTGETASVPSDHAHELLKIALGSKKSPSPEFGSYAGDFLVESSSAVDPVLRDRLVALDAHFDWYLRAALERDGRRALYDSYVDAHASRKIIRLDLSQVPLVPAAGFLRVVNMDAGRPRDFLLIGDDDLLSIPLAMMGHRVTVMDADAYLLSFIGREAQRRDLNIERDHRNMVAPFPEHYEAAFDAVHADPPSGATFLNALVHRAFRVLRSDGRLYVSSESDLGPLLESLATELGGRCASVWPRISSYYHAGTMELESDAEDVRVFCPPDDRAPVMALERRAPERHLAQYDMQNDFSVELYGCREDLQALADELDELLCDEGELRHGDTEAGWWRCYMGDDVSLVLQRRGSTLSVDYRSPNGLLMGPILQSLLQLTGAMGHHIQNIYRGPSLAEHIVSRQEKS